MPIEKKTTAVTKVLFNRLIYFLQVTFQPKTCPLPKTTASFGLKKNAGLNFNVNTLCEHKLHFYKIKAFQSYQYSGKQNKKILICTLGL